MKLRVNSDEALSNFLINIFFVISSNDFLQSIIRLEKGETAVKFALSLSILSATKISIKLQCKRTLKKERLNGWQTQPWIVF